MSVEKWGWTSVTLTVGAALALIAFLVVYASGLDSGQNQAIAAWVQAVGSIITIAGAYHLGARQMEHATALQRDTEIRAALARKDTLRAIAQAAVDRANWADARLFLPGFQANVPAFAFGHADAVAARLEDARRAMDAVPMHEISNAAAVIAWSDLSFAVADAAEAIRDAGRAYSGAGILAPDFDAGMHPGKFKLVLNSISGSFHRLSESLSGVAE